MRGYLQLIFGTDESSRWAWVLFGVQGRDLLVRVKSRLGCNVPAADPFALSSTGKTIKASITPAD